MNQNEIKAALEEIRKEYNKSIESEWQHNNFEEMDDEFTNYNFEYVDSDRDNEYYYVVRKLTNKVTGKTCHVYIYADYDSHCGISWEDYEFYKAEPRQITVTRWDAVNE